jgi:hypothetical protein
MAMATWTVDGGDGPDDRAVFITSEGDLIVYQGTNPSSSAAWEKVGSYSVGKPLGRRCFTKYGGDVLLITENGVFPLSKLLQSSTIDYTTAISDKISSVFTESARNYGNVFGWKAIVHPAQSALIVNVPISEDGEHEQYVMNTFTGAWCKFKEWDAEDFEIFNEELYYTVGTAVHKAWTGRIDGEDNIVAYAKQAFSYLGNAGLLKDFKMMQPVLAVNGSLSFLTDIDVDFGDGPIVGTASYTVISGAQWDVDDWDEGYWAPGIEVVKQWTSPAEYMGYCVAGKIKVITNSLTVQWMATMYLYERGTSIG